MTNRAHLCPLAHVFDVQARAFVTIAWSFRIAGFHCSRRLRREAMPTEALRPLGASQGCVPASRDSPACGYVNGFLDTESLVPLSTSRVSSIVRGPIAQLVRARP